MTRWILLFSACPLQILGLFLMYRGKHFSLVRPDATPAHKYARRSGRLFFAVGVLALAVFAVLESNLLLLTGQGILILLCLAGTPKLYTTRRKGSV